MILAAHALALLLGANGSTEARWRWHVACEEPAATRIVVTLDGRSLLDTVVPVCRILDAERDASAEEKVLTFSFRGDPSRFTSDVRPAPRSAIEGNVWEAGGETGAIIFGVSLATKDHVLLNDLHVADAERPSHETLSKGLEISTTPFRRKEGPRMGSAPGVMP